VLLPGIYHFAIFRSVKTENHDNHEGNMNESRYEAVIFKDIAKEYPSDANIVCRFATKAHERQPGDKIAVFKLGWSNTNESIVGKLVDDAISEPSGEWKLDFHASICTSHETDSEFLQFVYLSGENVKGASTPFQIYRPKEEDMTEVVADDGDDFVVLKSKDAKHQEEKDALILKISELMAKNATTEAKERESKKLMLNFQAEKYTLEKENVELKLQIQEYSQKMDDLKAELKSCESGLQAKEDEIAEHRKQMKTLKFALDDATNKIRERDVDLYDLKKKLDNERAVTVGLRENFEVEFGLLKRELDSANKKVAALSQTLQESEKNCEEKEQGSHLLEATIDKLTEQLSKLDCEKKGLRDQLQNQAAIAESHQVHLVIQKNLLEEEKEKLENEHKLQVERYERELDAARKTIESLSNQVERTAMEKESSKVREVELSKKVQELTSRLEVAKEEYEKQATRHIKLEGKYNSLKEKVNKFIKASRSPVSGNTEVKETANSEERGRAEEELVAAASSSAATESTSPEVVTLPCTICRQDIVCSFRDLRQMMAHLEEVHKQRVCPVCSQLFDASMAGIDEYFTMHVESHFETPEFPPSNE